MHRKGGDFSPFLSTRPCAATAQKDFLGKWRAIDETVINETSSSNAVSELERVVSRYLPPGTRNEN